MSTPPDSGGDSGREEAAGDAPPGGRDPRRIVTPYAFRVSDGLMGTPLASPWRRALAMLVDLVAVALVVGVRAATGPLFLLLLAWLAYRATTERARRPVRRPLPRLGLRAVAVLLFLTGAGQGIVNAGEIWGGGEQTDAPASERGVPAEAAIEGAAARTGADVGFGEIRAAVDAVSDLRSGDTARTRAAAVNLMERLRGAGMTRTEIRKVLLSLEGAEVDTAIRYAAEEALAGLDSAATARDTIRRARADSLAREWADALDAGDTASASVARDTLAGLLTADTIAALERRISALGTTLDRTEDQLEEAEEPPGILDFLRGVARDLGLGFGTLGLYFTAFLALWDGQTPGKRLLGIRVVRVNGGELGWWDAFSRFGGYAASVATGLIGFLQITWDANRQGLHDRIAGTVVIRESPE